MQSFPVTWSQHRPTKEPEKGKVRGSCWSFSPLFGTAANLALNFSPIVLAAHAISLLFIFKRSSSLFLATRYISALPPGNTLEAAGGAKKETLSFSFRRRHRNPMGNQWRQFLVRRMEVRERGK
jgi:hypothetical protein